MTRAFVYATKLQERKQLMMVVSNLTQTIKEVIFMAKVIDEKEEFKKCMYCTQYKKGVCSLKHCEYLLDRVELGAIKYKDIIKDFWNGNSDYHFKKRLRFLVGGFTGEFFLSPYHQDRYTLLKSSSALLRKTKNKYLGAIYLLSSDEDLWNRAKDCIFQNEICFEDTKLTNIRTNGYALYKAAKGIYNNTNGVEISELADPTLISETTFKAIINAKMIAELSDRLLQTRQ